MEAGLKAGKLLTSATSQAEHILTWRTQCRVRLFGANFLEILTTPEQRDKAVKEVVEVLEGVGRRQHDGAFTVNYIRLRFVAQKNLV